MLMTPKGFEYWTDDGILDTAPYWAKKEYEDYHQLMDQSIIPDEKSEVTNY